MPDFTAPPAVTAAPAPAPAPAPSEHGSAQTPIEPAAQSSFFMGPTHSLDVDHSYIVG